MTDGSLDFVTTDAIVQELKRRCCAGVIVLAYNEERGEFFRADSWGSMFWRKGVTETLADRFSELSDTLIAGPGQVADTQDD